LLAAVGVTIAVGEAAKAKTSASNSADASSLATASFQAGAFNKLVARNKDLESPLTAGNSGYYMKPEDTYQYYKEMKDYYLEMRDRYKILYDLGNLYLTGYPEDNAKYYLQETLEILGEALAKIDVPITDCTLANSQLEGAQFNRDARVPLNESIKCIAAFNVLTSYMQEITYFFKSTQINNFCEAKSFMHGDDTESGEGGAWKKSREAGQQYGFNNSAIMSMLTPAQGDDFNFQLATGALFGGATATYSPPGSSISVSVNVELPKILTYQLKHTNWNFPEKHALFSIAFPCEGLDITREKIGADPFNVASSGTLYDNLIKVSNYLEVLAQKGDAIFSKTQEGVNCCNAGEECDPNPFPPPPEINCRPICPNPVRFFNEARNMQTKLSGLQKCVISGLTKISTLPKHDLTIPGLQEWNVLIRDNVWPYPDGSKVKYKEVGTCKEVIDYFDVAPDYPGMMIINIQSVTLDGNWETTSTVNASSGGTATTSTSTSKFDGGDIGTFKDAYYPEIIRAN
jgi:hypothetical protein